MEWLLAALGIAGTASGWYAAWRSRGDANQAGERARLAGARADAADARAVDAEMHAVAAEAQRKGAEIDVQNARQAIARERAAAAEILETLAKAGAPVGDVLLDGTIDRLYADRDRQRAGRGPHPGAGGDPVDVPAPPAGAARSAGTR